MIPDLRNDILSRCSKIECLAINISLPVDELISTVNRRLWDSQIHTLCLFEGYSFSSERVGHFSLELSELFQINDIRQLHVNCFEEMARVSCHQDIPSCPSLKQLSVTYLKEGDDVLRALRKAIQRSRLPNLNYLDLWRSSFNTEGILPYLFGSWTPALEHLSLMGLKLNESDLLSVGVLRTLRSLYFSTQPFLQTETVQCLAVEDRS